MRVAIIGSGPAGLFCADRLADKCDVTVFEAGSLIDERECPESGCKMCKRCDILEGEGGAGGLSDGKNTYSLSRGTQMESIFEDEDSKWMLYIDSQIVRFAGYGVWYSPLEYTPEGFENSPLKFDSYPLRHVGSDGIRKFVRGFIDQLKHRNVRFDYSKVYPVFSAHNKAIVGIHDELYAKNISYDITVIAAGLQGIPWIERFMTGVGSSLGYGPAGFGVRLEMDSDVVAELHRQFYDYKITYNHESGIVLRSFCCNQNGTVVNENHIDLGIINVNGHSFLDPNMRTKSSNMAIIAKIPEDFITHPQSFVFHPQTFVRTVASRISDSYKNSIYQPLAEFIGEKTSTFSDEYMTNKQSVRADIAGILASNGLYEAFKSYIIELNKIVPIISSTSVIYAPEIKYYGRRVNVDNRWKSKDIDNLYVIGSGSGYIDSFVAAALSGIIAAENIKKEDRNAKN